MQGNCKGSLKSRTDLLSQLTRFSLPLDCTVPVLRKRLTMHLQTLAAEIGNSKFVQVNPSLEKPTSICAASEDILLCADDTQRGVFQVQLHYNGVEISGTGMKLSDWHFKCSIYGSFGTKSLLCSCWCSRWSVCIQPIKLRSRHTSKEQLGVLC